MIAFCIASNGDLNKANLKTLIKKSYSVVRERKKVSMMVSRRLLVTFNIEIPATSSQPIPQFYRFKLVTLEKKNKIVIA